MENKQFNFHSEELQFKEAKLKGEKKFYIEGYASTTDKDLAGEVINDKAQTSMLNQFRNRNITIDVEHEEWYDADGKQLPKPKSQMIPVAKVIEARQDDKGTFIKAEMNTSIERFDEVWGSIKGKFLNAFSIGFFPITQVGNVISDLNIVNLTLTGTPVNKEATFAPVLKSAVAYLKSIETESETKMNKENIKAEPAAVVAEPVVEPVKPAEKAPVEPVTPVKTEPVQEPVVEPDNGLKTEAEVKQEAITEAEKKLAELRLQPTKEVKETVTKPNKETELSDMINKIMDTKLQEWEDKLLKKSDDEPKQKPITKEPKAQQEVTSKPITPLGMIKAFKMRQGELGNVPKLKALVEETPEAIEQTEKSRTPLQLIK